jgi:hypothetical protein
VNTIFSNRPLSPQIHETTELFCKRFSISESDQTIVSLVTGMNGTAEIVADETALRINIGCSRPAAHL